MSIQVEEQILKVCVKTHFRINRDNSIAFSEGETCNTLTAPKTGKSEIAACAFTFHTPPRMGIHLDTTIILCFMQM